MTMTGNIGRLLISIDNAVVTVFGDNAHITHLIPSPSYSEDGTILDITISILQDKYTSDELKQLLEIFDNLIYNPLFNSDATLSKVNIVTKEI